MRLVFHHLSYNKDSVIYNKFGKSNLERMKYNINLLDEISRDKTNFLVLCINCHEKLEKLLKLSLDEVSQIKQDIPERLIKSYNKTRRKRGLQELDNSDSYKLKWKNDDVFYESFVERVNYILNRPDLDELNKEFFEKERRHYDKDVVDTFESDKFELFQFACMIPDSWGYSFHEGDSYLHFDNYQICIGWATNNDVVAYLLGLGVEHKYAEKLCDRIAWILDCSFFRQLIPSLKDECQTTI